MRNHTTVFVTLLRIAMLAAQFGGSAAPGSSVGAVAYQLTATVFATPAPATSGVADVRRAPWA